MKFSPTVPLALALAAGIAGTAAAQTPATPGIAPNSPQAAVPSQAIPPNTQGGISYSEAQPSAGQPQPAQPAYGQVQPSAGQAQPTYTQTNPGSPAGAGIPGTAPTGPGQSLSGQASPQNSSAAQVRTAQEQLQAAGLYAGPVDGLMDPDTRAAIARFQQQNGMQRSGMLDQATLDRLMANRTSGSGSGAPGASLAAPNGNQGMTTAPMGAGGTNAPGNQTINR